MSTPGSAGSTDPGQPASPSTEPLYFFPAGLQLLYDVEKTNVRSLKHAFFLATHWIMTRGGLRRTTTELNLPGSYETRRAVTTFDETPAVAASTTEPTAAQVLAAITEIPEPGWADKIDGVQEAPVIFTYMNPLALEEGYYKLEFYALNDTDMIVRLINPHGPATRKQFLEKKPNMVHGQVDNRSSTAASYVMSDFVRFGEEYSTALGIFYKASLLEKTVFRNLFERLGLPVNGPIPKSIGIYDDKVPERATTENRTRDGRSEYYRDEPNPYRPNYPRRPMPDPGGVGGPLYGPPIGIGGLGRSDLDPLGGVGAGMLADPRGFRRTGPPAYPLGGGPGRLPPGARFDPFGPVGPGQAPFPGPPPPGRNPGQFAGPNPDHEQPPPGFEDMFM